MARSTIYLPERLVHGRVDAHPRGSGHWRKGAEIDRGYRAAGSETAAFPSGSQDPVAVITVRAGVWREYRSSPGEPSPGCARSS